MTTQTLPITTTEYPNGITVRCEPQEVRTFTRQSGYGTKIVRRYFAETPGGKLIGRFMTGKGRSRGSFNGHPIIRGGYREWLSRAREWSPR